LGDTAIADLTPERLRRWLSDLANSPAFKRTAKGKPQAYKPEPTTEEGKRKRRASANRVLATFKALLNHAYDEGHVASNAAWGRRLKPFEGADAARLRYLTIPEAKRLINTCDPEFRLLVQAALFTGARLGQLVELIVDHFNADAGTIELRSRKGRGKLKVYNAVLTDEGRAFFTQACAGQAGHELVFRRTDRVARGKKAEGDANGWREAEQSRLMAEACARAKISPAIGFHGLRHTYASLSVMNGVPLIVIAQNLGHAGTAMVEKHYGHLAPSFIADAIRKGAPKFGFKTNKKIVPLRERAA
jgi:integrase